MTSNQRDQFTIVLFSGDFDKAMAALTLANGGAGRNLDVTIFFTFWGLNLIRKKLIKTKHPLENLFKKMMPIGADKIGLSKMNFCGIGPRLMKKLIDQKKGQTASDLLELAMERNIHFIACEASLKMLGICKEELIEYKNLEIGGIDAFIPTALDSKIAMFI